MISQAMDASSFLRSRTPAFLVIPPRPAKIDRNLDSGARRFDHPSRSRPTRNTDKLDPSIRTLPANDLANVDLLRSED
jgi:hypothetical protein